MSPRVVTRHQQLPERYPERSPQSDAGVFGASVSGEGSFSKYVGRDVELDPTAPVTAVLTVAHIPPEEGGDGSVKPRVKCFVVNDTPQNRRNRSKQSVDGVAPVLMECVPTGSGRMNLGRAATGGRSPARSTATRNRGNAASKAMVGGSSATTAGAGFDTHHHDDAGTVAHKGRAGPTGAAEGGRSGGHLGTPRGAKETQPRRQSRRASTMARSRSASRRALFELSPPSVSVPLEDADTVFLVGDHPNVLNKTTAWMEKLLPGATILGGISSCALVIADQVRAHAHGPHATVAQSLAGHSKFVGYRLMLCVLVGSCDGPAPPVPQ